MPLLGSPRQWGLPEKFRAFRPGQEEAILQISDYLVGGYRIVGVCAPTGAGKSGQYMTLHALMGSTRTGILTQTKALQDQLLGDFASMGLVDVRGRSSYACSLMPFDCEIGMWRRCRYAQGKPALYAACPAQAARAGALDSELIVSNYHYALTGEMGKLDLLILDEAHRLPSLLDDFLEVAISRHEAPRAISPCQEALPEWRRWGAERLKALRPPDRGVDASAMREYHLLKRRFETLATIDESYIVDVSSDGRTYLFAPLWPQEKGRKLFEPLLGSSGTVLVSATATPKTAEICGLGGGEYAHYEAASIFDPRRSPVYYLPVARVERRMTPEAFAQVVRRIDQILDSRPDVKGVIHTVAYHWASKLYEASSNRGRLLLHNARNLRSVIDDFKHTSQPAVLVTPACTTGVDFPDDECRLQIQLKVPLKNLSDRKNLNKARKADDPDWMLYDSLQDLVQAIPGRGMRGEGDWCENFLLDANANWAVLKKKHLLPHWWLRCLRTCSTIPERIRF